MSRLSRVLSVSVGLALSTTALVGSVHAESPTASAADFIESTVAPDIDTYWRQQSRLEGVPYVTPQVFLFDASSRPPVDACSQKPVTGHEYCPADGTIYLDVGTSDEASFGRLWATDSNFTIVTIVAHEWGHAVQDQRRAFNTRLNTLGTEQQADCLSGVFADYAQGRGWLDPGDMQAALALALRSGDSSHGPGWQRERAFEIGFNGGTPSACGLA
jgi:predicted metalloprotease